MRGEFFRRLATDESGQAITEYILIVAISVILAGRFARELIGVLDRGVLYLGAELEKNLKTGRAPLDVWKN